MEEVAVASVSSCVGGTLRSSGLTEQPGIIIVAIKRTSGKMLFNPAADEKLEAGDRVVALAEATQLKDIERRLRGEG